MSIEAEPKPNPAPQEPAANTEAALPDIFRDETEAPAALGTPAKSVETETVQEQEVPDPAEFHIPAAREMKLVRTAERKTGKKSPSRGFIAGITAAAVTGVGALTAVFWPHETGNGAPNPNESVATGPAVPGTSETPGSSVEPDDNESLSPVEQLGQDTEIPRDQLNIMEQTTPLGEMLAMVEAGDMESIAKLDVADRAALGYYIAKKIIPGDQQTYNVNELDNDQVSFVTQEDIDNGVRMGGSILAATGKQFGSLIYATQNEARALALASWYQPLDATGKIAPYAKHSMENNEHISELDHVEAIYPGAKKETGWIESTDNQGRKQWMKVIEQIIPDEGIDQTGQIVRVTVHTEDGKDIFWYMDGQVGDKQGGDELEKFSQLKIG